MIVWAEGGAERGTVISYEAEEYDGFLPIPRIFLDARVLNGHGDREALAYACLFFPHIGGKIAASREINSQVAPYLRQLLWPRSIEFTPVTGEPQKLPDGTRRALVIDGSLRSLVCFVTTAPDLCFETSLEAITSMIGSRRIVLAGNVDLLPSQSGELWRLLPKVGALLLLAEDHVIGEIVLPVRQLSKGETRVLKALTAALSAVNIQCRAPLLNLADDELHDLLSAAPSRADRLGHADVDDALSMVEALVAQPGFAMALADRVKETTIHQKPTKVAAANQQLRSAYVGAGSPAESTG